MRSRHVSSTPLWGFVGDVRVVPLPWDSELFGFPIARIEARPDSRRLLELARAAGIRCAYYECETGDLEAIRSAEASGCQLVEVRVTLEATLAEMKPRTKQHGSQVLFEIGRVGSETGAELRRLATEVSENSRFALDPGFGPSQARKLYERWVDVSLEGRAELIMGARDGQYLQGFISCRVKDRMPFLELVAVDRRLARSGVGTALVDHVAEALRDLQHSSARVVTQARNVRALRFYERCGFRVVGTSLMYHRWF